MTVKVRFFAYFRELFGGKEKRLELEADTSAGRLLDILGDSPARRKELSSRHLVVMINGTNISSRDGLATALQEGDVVAVFPLMGGG
jgi:molybdopterin synthase sulfur carrier subunit